LVDVDVERGVRARAGHDGDHGNALRVRRLELGVEFLGLAHGADDAVDALLNQRVDLLGVLRYRALGVEHGRLDAGGPGMIGGGVGGARVGVGRHLERDDADLGSGGGAGHHGGRDNGRDYGDNGADHGVTSILIIDVSTSFRSTGDAEGDLPELARRQAHRKNDYNAEHDVLDVVLGAEQGEAIAQRADGQRPDQGADDVGLAGFHRGHAEQHRRDAGHQELVGD